MGFTIIKMKWFLLNGSFLQIINLTAQKILFANLSMGSKDFLFLTIPTYGK